MTTSGTVHPCFQCMSFIVNTISTKYGKQFRCVDCGKQDTICINNYINIFDNIITCNNCSSADMFKNFKGDKICINTIMEIVDNKKLFCINCSYGYITINDPDNGYRNKTYVISEICFNKKELLRRFTIYFDYRILIRMFSILPQINFMFPVSKPENTMSITPNLYINKSGLLYHNDKSLTPLYFMANTAYLTKLYHDWMVCLDIAIPLSTNVRLKKSTHVAFDLIMAYIISNSGRFYPLIHKIIYKKK